MPPNGGYRYVYFCGAGKNTIFPLGARRLPEPCKASWPSECFPAPVANCCDPQPPLVSPRVADNTTQTLTWRGLLKSRKAAIMDTLTQGIEHAPIRECQRALGSCGLSPACIIPFLNPLDTEKLLVLGWLAILTLKMQLLFRGSPEWSPIALHEICFFFFSDLRRFMSVVYFLLNIGIFEGKLHLLTEQRDMEMGWVYSPRISSLVVSLNGMPLHTTTLSPPKKLGLGRSFGKLFMHSIHKLNFSVSQMHFPFCGT